MVWVRGGDKDPWEWECGHRRLTAVQLGAQILNLGSNGHLHFEKGRFENIFSSWENMSFENFEIEKIEFWERKS